MRSCLVQLVILLAVGFALLWIGLPLGAGWLATTALNANGFTGTDTKVVVTSNPPPLLLTGHADSIHLTSTKASVHGLEAGAVDLVLTGVDLIGRKFDTVSGSLDQVTVTTPDGQPVTVGHVAISGTATAATASLTMTNAQAQSLAESELRAKLNAQASVSIKVTLKAPDRMTISINGKSQSARLIVAGGALLLVPDGNSIPTVTLVTPGAGNPFQITGVTLNSAGATLTATIDIQSLLM